MATNLSRLTKAQLIARINELEAGNPPSNTQEVPDVICTNVQVFPFKETTGYCRGLATIVLNDAFLLRGLRIMEGENGLFVGYPHDPFFKGEDFRSLCNPITRKLREHIENEILTKYQALIG